MLLPATGGEQTAETPPASAGVFSIGKSVVLKPE
jgi:hypothetical protein